LVEPYSIFSDCFATMAFAELFKATKNESYKEIALKTYKNIEERQENPKGKWSKGASGRQLKNFALPMILCNLALILEDIVGK
jgi:N-acylglucosamine 2-epimerase